MSYDNTDTGALFKNDKRGNEKAPDYTGEIYDASGTKRRIAAWLKTSSGGKAYMSLKVTDVQQPKDYEKQTTQYNNAPGTDPLDDIPF